MVAVISNILIKGFGNCYHPMLHLTSKFGFFYNKAIRKMKGVSTMLLFGKFCIGFGSAQSYKTEHCVEPNQINRFI